MTAPSGERAGVRGNVLRLLFALLLLALSAACDRSPPDAVPGIRLGMAPRDVRDRFEPGGEGGWRVAVGATADDTAIVWEARDPKAGGPATFRAARFEFHLGMLVAIRATRNAPPPPRESVSVTPTIVTAFRDSGTGATDIAVLARDCPTHKDEAAALVQKSK